MSNRVLGNPHFSNIQSYSWITRVPNLVLVFLFFIVLCLPLFAWQTGLKIGAPLDEQRTMAPPPTLTWGNKANIFKETDAYIQDHFGFRDLFIHTDNYIRHQLLKASSALMIMGKDDWLFYTPEHTLDDFLGQALFTQEQMHEWRRHLEHRQRMLSRLGIRYLFIVAPDKDSIYPEMLPDYIRERKGLNRLDQFLVYLREKHSQLNILDLRKSLLEAKSKGLLYYTNDTHWNGLGYYFAYLAIIQRVKIWLPDLNPLRLGDKLEVRDITWTGGDWSILGLPENNLRKLAPFLFPIGTWDSRLVPAIIPDNFPKDWAPSKQPIKTENDHTTKHRLLMFHDSFMRHPVSSYILPFAEDFASTMLIWTSPTSDQFEAVVESERPDIVIEERVQRQFSGSPLMK